ncbi:hypothetical protein LTR10_016881 [Elasticomyces elasticus]|uniref:Uncharacterized protein n=1 Tax=Exophiala sideris TaxID=1016849 RepID=A0ABR0JKF9_9EURO|nr:hypothetical protein LTR10_016881 [Elasticomyces elasticus]KAK5035350.1 hypothetical protein LTS07_002786 [Exophiala sideris]KAK5039299.1 hypothetical protein LTR13_003556 [Exophiala sideris]KAK5066274.1 hypothetical protein LTR69_002792 [Exophiala sideris]KAK5186951.1 hypothetical protein LTR44_000957 [Eurotiomycetes sp. CCFEE 6388]
MQNSPEQQQITAGFNKFCSWYAQVNGRHLIVHALRETAPIAPRILPGVLVVTPTSADVEASTKRLTTTLTRDLTGLSHVQVTHFANGQDPNLAIIVESFATIMSATPPPQAAAPELAPGPAAGPGVGPSGVIDGTALLPGLAAGPAAGPSGAGGGTALLPGPSTLRRNVPGSSGSVASAVPGPSSAGSQATADGPAPL